MMADTGLKMLMESLKLLIYSNDNPLINENPSILSLRPQFQLLYEELGSMNQTLFIDEDQDHLHNLEKVRDLKKRFKDVAEEAQDIIDLFVSAVYVRKKGNSPRSDVFTRSLSLEDVTTSIKSIKMELLTMNIENMKMDSCERTDRLQPQSPAAAGTSTGTRNTQRWNHMEEIVVGLDRDLQLIRDKLVEDQKQLNIVSIVGMGGLGKTTLANKVFNERYVVFHFHIRIWVTVSQTYKKRDFLIQALTSIGVDEHDLERASDPQLREWLHKRLMGKRCLIVVDDIWTIEAWNGLKLFFPRDDTGSRILVTTRVTEVARLAKSHGFVHHLQYLKEEESWELLSKKVFHGKDCPKCLIKYGIEIARNCQGLPLAVVVIAGVLAKEAKTEDVWKKIACSVRSYITSDQNGCLETLALSYQHLPLHLRECFLYLGGFPEDLNCHVQRLIWLWVAEGFILEDGNRSLEEIAEDYLMDLVNRNLLIVVERKFHGGVKALKVHDLVRELCLKKAKEERFFLKIQSSPFAWEFIMANKQRRVFTNLHVYAVSIAHPPTPSIRSFLCFHNSISLINDIADYFYSFALLRVLDLQNCKLTNFPQGIALLIHLRYLAIWYSLGFPSSICNLWTLQTLVIKTSADSLILPSNISNLVNLRHLWCSQNIYFGPIEKPMNLRTISNVVLLGDGAACWLKCFPCIKKLATYLDEDIDFGSLTCLDALKLTGMGRRGKSNEQEFPKVEPNCGKNHIRFPATLKKLTLVRCRLPWTDMSIIQSLPNLEVLKLKDNAFRGTLWKTGEDQFRQLKFFRLEELNIRRWEASSINFPCLKRLQVVDCFDLEEIPLEIGDISTLELIKIHTYGSSSLFRSVEIIQEEQRAAGNCDLKIDAVWSNPVKDGSWNMEDLVADLLTSRLLDAFNLHRFKLDRFKTIKEAKEFLLEYLLLMKAIRVSISNINF